MNFKNRIVRHVAALISHAIYAHNYTYKW